MEIVVTGGAGFIGANYVKHVLSARPVDSVVVLDALTYAGNLETLKPDLELHPKRLRFVQGDIRDAGLVGSLLAQADAVVHFAAESHVDRSIADPLAFVRTNVEGTAVLIEAARKRKLRFVHVSTDEVYGSLGPTGLFTEQTPLAPNSPYAASKAASDLLVRAAVETFGLDAVITRCSNNYGPYQFPEKLIPFFLAQALSDATLPLYGDGLNVRDWLHVEDHVAAIDLVLREGRTGEVYNIGGRNEKANVEIAKALLGALGKPESLLRYVKDRPGHDKRYAIDASKIERELGWVPVHTFETGLAATVEWYLSNRGWWEPLRAKGIEASRQADNQVTVG